MNIPRSRFAFTLIELLVVVSIITILASLLIAALPGFLERGRMGQSLNNLRQIGVAFQLYSGENDFRLPGRITSGDKWPKLLIEYLDGDPAVYADPADERNFVRTNEDPLANGSNHTSYIMNGYNDTGAFDDEAVPIKQNAIERPSQTILLATQSHTGNFYMDFADGDQNSVLDKRLYGKGSTYLFSEGSSHFISEEDYDGPAPTGSAAANYGDWLWLVDKENDPSGGG